MGVIWKEVDRAWLSKHLKGQLWPRVGNEKWSLSHSVGPRVCHVKFFGSKESHWANASWPENPRSAARRAAQDLIQINDHSYRIYHYHGRMCCHILLKWKLHVVTYLLLCIIRTPITFRNNCEPCRNWKSIIWVCCVNVIRLSKIFSKCAVLYDYM